jgi:hypothetical protein
MAGRQLLVGTLTMIRFPAEFPIRTEIADLHLEIQIRPAENKTETQSEIKKLIGF